MRSFTDIKDLSKSDLEAILFRTMQEKKVIAEKGNLDIESNLEPLDHAYEVAKKKANTKDTDLTNKKDEIKLKLDNVKS